MKKITLFVVAVLSTFMAMTQVLKETEVPAQVKNALHKKFPDLGQVSWEKEKSNYEANWGGKSGEDHAALFTPSGDFLEIVHAIPVKDLPATIAPYIKIHFGGATIREAGKISFANGREGYEVEIKGKDLLFDKQGKYLGVD